MKSSKHLKRVDFLLIVLIFIVLLLLLLFKLIISDFSYKKATVDSTFSTNSASAESQKKEEFNKKIEPQKPKYNFVVFLNKIEKIQEKEVKKEVKKEKKTASSIPSISSSEHEKKISIKLKNDNTLLQLAKKNLVEIFVISQSDTAFKYFLNTKKFIQYQGTGTLRCLTGGSMKYDFLANVNPKHVCLKFNDVIEQKISNTNKIQIVIDENGNIQ